MVDTSESYQLHNITNFTKPVSLLYSAAPASFVFTPFCTFFAFICVSKSKALKNYLNDYLIFLLLGKATTSGTGCILVQMTNHASFRPYIKPLIKIYSLSGYTISRLLKKRRKDTLSGINEGSPFGDKMFPVRGKQFQKSRFRTISILFAGLESVWACFLT